MGDEVEGLTLVGASQPVHRHLQPERAGGLHLQRESCYRMSLVRTLQGAGLKGCSASQPVQGFSQGQGSTHHVTCAQARSTSIPTLTFHTFHLAGAEPVLNLSLLREVQG